MCSSRIRRFLLSSLIAASATLALVIPARAQWPPDSLKNLKVLPKDITFQELFQTMSGFTRALGVRCSYCHMGDPNGSLAEYDFVSDEKPTKRKARQMLEMVSRINDVHLAGLETRSTPAVTVQCMTCHRGVNKPRMIEDILIQAYEGDGVDSTIATYRRLRERYYGRSAYDFGEVPLVAVAGQVAARGAIPDALRLLELNADMNPESVFARTQLMTLALNSAFMTNADAGRQAYAGFRARFSLTGIPESLLNSVGYALLRRKQTAAAVAAFQLNVDAYPESANVYDSLGEGLTAAGNAQAAIQAYEKSLQLNPQNANATQKLRELRRR